MHAFRTGNDSDDDPVWWWNGKTKSSKILSHDQECWINTEERAIKGEINKTRLFIEFVYDQLLEAKLSEFSLQFGFAFANKCRLFVGSRFTKTELPGSGLDYWVLVLKGKFFGRNFAFFCSFSLLDSQGLTFGWPSQDVGHQPEITRLIPRTRSSPGPNSCLRLFL